MQRWNEVVCTRDEARKAFEEKGLSYMDITEGDIGSLALMIDNELKISNETGETSVCTMRMSSNFKIKCKKNGSIQEASLFMRSHYFSGRDCVTFNKNGYIGFAGWADDGNLNPIMRAFLKWTELIERKKVPWDMDVDDDEENPFDLTWKETD